MGAIPDWEAELKAMSQLGEVLNKFAYLSPRAQKRVMRWVSGYWYSIHLQVLFDTAKKDEEEKTP